MAEVSTSVQHLTALDFDISRAEAQLAQLEAKVNQITQRMANTNWTVRAAVANNGEIANLRTQLEAAAKETQNVTQQMINMNTQGTAATSRLVSTIQTRLVYALRNVAKEAANTVKEVELAMVNISRVMQLTASETDKLRDSLFDLGNEYGRSFEDVADISLRFAQAGYDMRDNISLTKDALLALNTAELDSEEATQSLIGILSQWGYEAEDLITVIDKLNYTADNNAITTQDLIDGLLKASSMAKTAGMSFDDTVGILTSMKVASGAAGKEVGNAFKSIMAYIQRPESLKLFESMGIDVFADRVTGELLPMMDILENMSAKWNANQEDMLNTLVSSGDALQMMSEEWAIATDSMDEYTQYQEAMAEATDKANTAEARAQAQAAAGVYRRNYYISLMENLNQAQQVSNDLMNAEGHSAAENARYMETLAAKIEQLVVSLKELAVAAADAGFIDMAKYAIEAATAFTKWTTNTKTLIPLLTGLAGVMITIKQQKLATELTAIGAAFRNAGGFIASSATNLVGVSTAANSAGTAMNAAAGAATGLSTALGAIGLVVTAISLVTTAVNTVKTAIKEARDEAIEAGKTADTNANSLLKLREEYAELENVSEKTTEQEQRMFAIEKEMVSILGEKAAVLEGVAEGTKKYTETLKAATEQELASIKLTQIQARDAAKEQLNSIKANAYDYTQIGNYRPGDLTSAGSYLLTTGYGKMGGGTVKGYGAVDFKMSDDTLENYINLSNAMDMLNQRAIELSNTYGNDVAAAFMDDSVYKNVEKNLAEIKESVEEYIEAEINLAETTYLLENGIPKTIQEQKAMEDSILETVGATEEAIDIYRSYISVLGTIDQQKVDFYKILDTEENETAKNALIEMAKAGQLNETTFNSVAHSTTGMSIEISKLGLNTGKCIEYITELAKSEKTVAKASGEAGKEIEDFAKSLESAESKISSLNKYIQTLGEGNGLTAEQVLELVDTYGLLIDQFTLTEKGYTIEVSALEQLRNAQIQEAIAAQESQIQQTLIIKENVLERLKAYGIEIEQITNLAEAQTALSLLQSDIVKESMSMSGSESDVKRMQSMAALADILEDVRDGFANTEDLAQGFYETLGISFEETKKSGEKTVDILKEITEGYEHLVSLGIYSTEEQIAYYENLRRTLSLTEEQYQSLESTLHKLYTTQLEESKEAIEAEYEAQKKAIEEQYELDKENSEEYWDNELDRLKDNLNSQIDSAKKAYEERKKLADKSYDNQKEALENLRDTEVENINAVYNAQIEALEKIKAARQAERDEADYQDERAELLEQISYYEQRTGTEAVEQLADLRKQLADLDEERRRELEDEEIDTQIDELEKQRDDEASAIKKQYEAQIAALQASQETELEMYEQTYKREIELLENRLEKETEALEKKRDEELKRLKENKDEDIKEADDKWKQIEAIFEERNLAMIASAGMFAPELYDKFHELFTEKFKMDLDELAKLMDELGNRSGSFAISSGTKPIVGVSNAVTSKVKNTEETSTGGFAVGTQVKVSGTVYADSYGNDPGKSFDEKKTTITKINPKGTKPYLVGNLGWVDESQLVKARTGGMTTADGLAMLHKNELIVNPPLTQKLEDLLDALVPQGEVVISPAIMKDLKQMADFYNRPQVYNTSNSNTDNHSKTVAVNINGPLQQIERVEDMADMNAVVNSLGREIMREVGRML